MGWLLLGLLWGLRFEFEPRQWIVDRTGSKLTIMALMGWDGALLSDFVLNNGNGFMPKIQITPLYLYPSTNT